jgi:hypothetical protein
MTNVVEESTLLFYLWKKYLRIDRNFCSVHDEITSLRLYTPGKPRSGLPKGAHNLIEVISNEQNK